MARFVQSIRSTNRGEQKMYDLLSTLPDEYTVISELRTDASFLNHTQELEERRPDFVVLGPDIGCVVIETKHWNLDRNQYVWVNQFKIRKDPDGVLVTNPWYQAFIYEKALAERLKGTWVWTTSMVAFPTLSRATLWNSLGDPTQLKDPQARMLIDLQHTLFEDDVAHNPGGLQQLLREVVCRSPRFRPVTQEELDEALGRLIPAEFKVGDASERRVRENQGLRVLTDRQQRAFQRPVGERTLLDLAGSGKTNVLVSRAIWLTKQAQGRPYRILLLTYSEKLARAMRLMLRVKLGEEELAPTARIDILSVDEVLVEIICTFYGITPEGMGDLLQSQLSQADRAGRLAEMFGEIGPELDERYRLYDAMLIDEVQDFSLVTPFLKAVLHKGEEFFVVGDIAQRIHQERLALHELDIDFERSKLMGFYTMYRCPIQVSEVAHRFILDDPLLKEELRNYGYSSQVTFRGTVSALPEAVRARDERHGVQLLAETIRKACEGEGTPWTAIMVVTAPDQLGPLLAALGGAGIPVKENPSADNAVLVVDFVESKGLEAEIVLVTGIERLPLSDGGLFADPVASAETASLSRRKVYVAVTRTTRRVHIIYTDPENGLVADLLRHIRVVGMRG